MVSTDIGIDLGTTNILIYVKKKGIVLNEPCVVAIEKNTKKVIAVGKKANEMVGRTPNKIEAVRPLKEGVITDIDITEIMLNEFINMIKAKQLFIKPRILISCSTNISPRERETIREVAERTGARKIYIEEAPRAAAIGAGMNIKEPIANMIVDLGGGTTDIAVLSIDGIVKSSSIKIAGEKLNEDIVNYLKEKYRLLIGLLTAEKIKTTFINIYNPQNKKIEVRGRDLITGLPSSIELTQTELKDAVQNSINKIISEIKKVLENTPPELSADIIEKGIVLTGGSSKLNGLLERIEDKIKVSVLIAESPETCVVEGTGILLDEIKRLEEDQ